MSPPRLYRPAGNPNATTGPSGDQRDGRRSRKSSRWSSNGPGDKDQPAGRRPRATRRDSLTAKIKPGSREGNCWGGIWTDGDERDETLPSTRTLLVSAASCSWGKRIDCGLSEQEEQKRPFQFFWSSLICSRVQEVQVQTSLLRDPLQLLLGGPEVSPDQIYNL